VTNKLLVLTVGTVAAEVGQEFLKQVKAHPASELQAMVRYIDTTYLPTRYRKLGSGEWLQLTIDPEFIDIIWRNPQTYTYLKHLLYPGLLPQVQGSGGGSIRYNAAGAVAINREKIKRWLTTSISRLISSDKGQVDLSIALVVSAVGATGSGTVERMIDIIVDAVQDANLPSPLHCDTFILQPGMEGVTDLGLANTLALYAEMAASRLSGAATKNFRRGRTIMVGWGSWNYMASLDQLTREAATLIRVTHDPVTDITAEYQEREIDNHVLRERDFLTGLPSHLSSATAVTISLGNLEEKIVQRDGARLLDNLIFGKEASKFSNGDYAVSGAHKRERRANLLLDAVASFLEGETPEDRYKYLLARLTEKIDLQGLQITVLQTKGMKPQEQARWLRNIWQCDREEITTRSRQRILEQRTILSTDAIDDILQKRRAGMGTELSLRDLLDQYHQLRNVVTSVLNIAQGSIQGVTNETETLHKINALEKTNWINRPSTLKRAIEAVHNSLEHSLQREAYVAAIDVLKKLDRHCAEALRNLEIVFQKCLRQYRTNQSIADAYPLSIETDHPLVLPALITPQEITQYTEQISIFSTQKEGLEKATSHVTTNETERGDPVAEFRKWLEDQGRLDVLFGGDFNTLLEIAQNYARQYVHHQVEQHSVMDVMLQTGEETLSQHLLEAAAKAHSLVSFSQQYATDIRQDRYVGAYWRDDVQRRYLEKAINRAFGGEQCTLVRSKDPTEIVILYYVDGLPMSAVTDLTGRCLDAFLKRRRSWLRQSNFAEEDSKGFSKYNQRVSVPVYSGRDAEIRVLEAGVIRRIYANRRANVDVYRSEEVFELGESLAPQMLEALRRDPPVLLPEANELESIKALVELRERTDDQRHEFDRSGERKETEKSQLSLFALARAKLEEDDKAFVGESYSVQVGMSQSMPDGFKGGPIDLPARNLAEPVSFHVLLRTSESIKLTTDWHKTLIYYPRKPDPQLVEFTFQVMARGRCYLVFDFYHERRWLSTTRLEFDAKEKSEISIVSSEV